MMDSADSKESSKLKPPPKQVSQQDMDQMRERIRAILFKAHERANDSGKPLLILVGEAHNSPHSALLETVIYQEARELGINDIALELPSRLNFIREGLEKTSVSRGTLNGHILTYHQAIHFGSKVHLVDGRFVEAMNSKDLAIDSRNETIAANLALISNPTLMITGQAHLIGLQQRMKAHGTHTVVGFDVIDYKNYPQMNRQIAPNSHPLELRGDARLLSTDELLTMGLGAEEGRKFIDWSESAGRKYPAMAAIANHSKAQKILDSNPNDIPSLMNQAEALYELGKDEASAKSIVKFMYACTAPKRDKVSLQACSSHGFTDVTLNKKSEEFRRTLMNEMDRLLPAVKEIAVATAKPLTVEIVQEPKKDLHNPLPAARFESTPVQTVSPPSPAANAPTTGKPRSNGVSP